MTASSPLPARVLEGRGKRRLVGELMDDPAIPAGDHAAALRGLARLNWWSASTTGIHRAIEGYFGSTSPLTVLDLAAGAGDIAVGLWRVAHALGPPLEVSGSDRSEVALATARALAVKRRAPVSFFRLDVVREPLPRGFDILVSSLFLHHLRREEAVELLRRMADACTRGFLVSDLERRPGGIALAWFASRALTRSRVVHVDAVRSAQAAFTLEELEELCVEAGLEGARIERTWPWRLLLRWRRR